MLVISGTEHLVEVLDKLSTTAVVFFRSERILKCKEISGRLSLNAVIPNGLWTRWRKDLISPPDRLLMGATQVPNLPPMKQQTRVTLSYPTHKDFVKASERSVVGMASKPTSKVAEPSKAYWSPPRTKTLWSTKVVPSTDTNVVT